MSPWVRALVGLAFASLVMTGAPAAASTFTAGEEEVIAAELAGLRASDAHSSTVLRNLIGELYSMGRGDAVQALYKRIMAEIDYQPKDFTNSFAPPFWVRPSRMSNALGLQLDVAIPGLVRSAVSQGQHDEALALAEKARSRLLLAVLLARAKSVSLDAAGRFPEMTVARMRELAIALRSTFVFYYLVPAKYEPALNEGRQRANDIFAWVLRPDGTLHFADLSTAIASANSGSVSARLEQALSAFSQSLTRGAVDGRAKPSTAVRGSASPVEAAKEHLRYLHDALIEPLAAHLPANPDEQVVIIPDGFLHLVPFNALLQPDGKHLIDRHTLSVAPSFSVLTELRDAASRATRIGGRKPGAALVVGDPQMPRIPAGGFAELRLDPLPGAKEEARAIAALLRTKPLLGAQATEQAVVSRMRDAPIIHFATHGLLIQSSVLTLSETSGSLSADLPPGAIVLGASPTARPVEIEFPGGFKVKLPFNGFLASGKILTLAIDADLVTLSACDTARGRMAEQEVVGLPTSLLAAGARTVVMTLWAIPDLPTTELMIRFYQELIAGRSKAAALRAAMLAAKEKYADPQSWSAFTLIGLPQ